MLMRKRLWAVLLFVAALVMPGVARASQWQMQAADSRLTFSGTQAGAPFEGRFKSFSAEITFDRQNLAASRVVIVIDMASAESGSVERDTTVTGSDWFAVKQFPQGRFASESFTHLGGDRFECRGQLTIRGVTRPVVLPFTLEERGDEARAKGSLTINRIDYGVGQGSWASAEWVGHPVVIAFDLLARRQP